MRRSLVKLPSFPYASYLFHADHGETMFPPLLIATASALYTATEEDAESNLSGASHVQQMFPYNPPDSRPTHAVCATLTRHFEHWHWGDRRCRTHRKTRSRSSRPSPHSSRHWASAP